MSVLEALPFIDFPTMKCLIDMGYFSFPSEQVFIRESVCLFFALESVVFYRFLSDFFSLKLAAEVFQY
jgi:hypothetical protein